MSRQPLPEGSVIKMPNGGKYTIKRLIGEGGFSLIYSADAVGGTSSVVIKEFFPDKGANRDKSSEKVVPAEGCEERFYKNKAQFEQEGTIGGKVSYFSFQAIPFINSGNGYALMKQNSEDMRSLSELVDKWERNAPIPSSGNREDIDPVFPDMVRVRYALRIIESVLIALSEVHNHGYLHLDISSSNAIWAGREVETGENCEVFLADFGSSVEVDMDSGAYYPKFPVSLSEGFAAPETLTGDRRLTPATDLYSVGILLFYLCVGKVALEWAKTGEWPCRRKRLIQRETSYLSVPERILTELQRILIVSTDEMSNRYQTASDMLKDVRNLRNNIPIHPLNPDNSRAFTLYSLKSMLLGSEDTHYSWADELRDRRNVNFEKFPASIYQRISWKTFENDDHFLKSVLSEEIYNYLRDRIDNLSNYETALKNILSCNYDRTWKIGICEKIQKYGTRRLLEVSRSLLKNENAFFVNQRILFQLLGEEGEWLREYYINCECDMQKDPYVGLAMFTLFALLGPDGFKMLLPSLRDAGNLFFAL